VCDPKSIDEALEKSGLGWRIHHGDVLVVKRPEWIDDFGVKHGPELMPANGFKANIRQDTETWALSRREDRPDSGCFLGSVM
jgi:hypothetical protein